LSLIKSCLGSNSLQATALSPDHAAGRIEPQGCTGGKSGKAHGAGRAREVTEARAELLRKTQLSLSFFAFDAL